MRKWKCVGVCKEERDYFTIGKIYETNDNERGLISDNGYVFEYLKATEFKYGTKFEEIKEGDEKVNKFKVGDRVRIIKATSGSYGADGKIGRITAKKETNGLLTDEDGINIEVENGEVWRVGLDSNLKKLEDNSKTITITTSDTTTTLTDGTHTTSINRYYTDKHDDIVALEEVVKKYKSEMEEIERAEKMPKVGDMVKIVDKEELYPNYSDWLIENNVPFKTAVNWRENNRNFTQNEYKVVAIHPHRSCKNILALIEGHREAFIFGIEGLEVIK